MFRNFVGLLKGEFAGYDSQKFGHDVLAGIAVAAVALPLALAFGVASGASASAGLVTAIVAGVVIGLLSGAPYQISGPTGVMTAVLFLLAQQFGLPGVWTAAFLAGVLLLLLGLLKLGRVIAYIPSPVIAGFTAGIALVIIIGQLDNLLGIQTPAAHSPALKLLHYFQHGVAPSWRDLALGGIVILLMLLWPKKWQARIPSSIAAIVITLGISAAARWDVATVGFIPTRLPVDRLTLANIPWEHMGSLIVPACTIAVLGMMESLMCGATAGNLTGKPIEGDQELVAQGIGNMLLPFLGGVPATAAISRSSVGVASGGQTRLVSVVHSLVLIGSFVALEPLMSKIPLATLSGVLIVTALQMNDWSSLKFMFRHRFLDAIVGFFVTMICMVALDMATAILIGVAVSALLFMKDIAALDVQVQAVDPERLQDRQALESGRCHHIKVAYLTGPVFFAAVDRLNSALNGLGETHALILSMRGVPLLDICGVHALVKLYERLHGANCTVLLAAVQPHVRAMLQRGGLIDLIGEENIFWDAAQAIAAAEERDCPCKSGHS